MNRYFFYSVLFHTALLILVLFIIHPKVVKKPAPFVATIVTPEELQAKTPIQVPRGKESTRVQQMPRLPKNLPPPEKFSALPSSHAPAVKARSGGTVRTPEASTPQSSAVEPTPGQVQGLAEEGKRALIRNGISSQRGPSGPSAMTTREKLFDRDIIAKLTPKSEKSEDDNGITFDTKEYKYYGYMQRLRDRIEAVWRYPAEAGVRRLNGELYIRFTIKKDGRLGAVELVHTSGYKILDDAAIMALKDADPYWPLPDSWNQDSLTITGHFIYYYQNTYIR
ncbi:MAG: energy transducer TonB [Dissulfurispiraceae bacterium]